MGDAAGRMRQGKKQYRGTEYWYTYHSNCVVFKPKTPMNPPSIPGCYETSLLRSLVSLAGDGAHSILCRALNAGVRNDLVLVVSNGRLGDRADILRPSLQHVGVVRREHSGCGAHDGAEGIVELLSLGLVDGGLQSGACGRFGRVQSRNLWVLVEVVVVVGGCAYDRALCMLAWVLDM